jgi:LysM repeat protein
MPTGVRIYIAAQGDTVFGVAVRFGTSVEALLRVNPALRSRFTLVKGEPVVIPPARQKP